jgi:hypothetical protein
LRESEGERERVAERESERERERGSGPCSSSPAVRMYVRMLVLLSSLSSLFHPLFSSLCGALDTPFYRRKEMPSCTMGCSRELTWLAGKCPEPCTDNNVAVRGTSRVL